MLSRADAARKFDLPFDPEGDVAVLGDARTVIGTRETDHDLGGLKGRRLRTHGSLHEADVPIILSRPIGDEYARRAEDRRLHSYEVFEYASTAAPGGRSEHRRPSAIPRGLSPVARR